MIKKIWLVLSLCSTFVFAQGQEGPIQLIFNQPYYAAGDIAYFNVRMIASDQSTKPNGIVIAAILDGDNLIDEIRFKVINGIGSSQLTLPNDLASSVYTMQLSNQKGEQLMRVLLPVGGKVTSKPGKPDSLIEVGIQVSGDHLPRTTNRLSISLSDKKSGESLDGQFSVIVLNHEVLGEKPINSTTSNTTNSLSPRMIVEGYLINRKTSQLLPEHSTVMLYLQQSRMRYLTSTQSKGYFRSEVLDYYGEEELFLIAETPDGDIVSDLEIQWMERNVVIGDDAPLDGAISSYEKYNDKIRLIESSYQFYSQKDSLRPKSSEGTRLDAIAADYKIKPRDYVLFNSFGEFLKTVVAPIYYDEEESIVRVSFLKPYQSTAAPLYVIDGLVTLDTDYFLSIRQDDIEELSVVTDYRKLVKFGLLGKNGIVIVKTRLGDQRPPVDSNKLMPGLTSPMTFSNIRSEDAKASSIPYFKGCIFYEPNQQTQNGLATVEYLESDDLGLCSVFVIGLTNDGRPFIKEVSYEKAMHKAQN